MSIYLAKSFDNYLATVAAAYTPPASPSGYPVTLAVNSVEGVSLGPGEWFRLSSFQNLTGAPITIHQVTGVNAAASPPTLTIAGPVDGYPDAALGVGDLLGNFNSAGYLNDISAALASVSLSVGAEPFVVEQATDTTKDVQDWSDSAGNVHARIDPSFNISVDYPTDGTQTRYIGFNSATVGSGAITQFQWSVSDCWRNKNGQRMQLMGIWGIELYGACGAPWFGPFPAWSPGTMNDPNLSVVGTRPASPLLALVPAQGQTAPLVTSPAGFGVNADGSISLATLADTAAANGSLYFSSTTSKVTYKDAQGNLHAV